MVAGPRGGETRIVDLGGRRRPPGGRRTALLPRPREVVAWPLRRAARALRFLHSLARVRWFLLLAGSLLVAALGSWALGLVAVALGLSLLGFGLSTAALLLSRFDPLRALASRLPRRARWGAGAAAVGILSLMGLSSELVLGLVLFIGGFATVGALWGLLSRLLLPRGPPGAVGRAQPDLLPVVAAAGLVALIFALAGLPLLLLPQRLGPWGPVLAGALAGLILGLLPTEVALLREARHPTQARWFAFRARRLLRDCLFSAAVLALLARALAVEATEGSAGPLGLGLIVASYLYAVARRLPALAPPGPRPHPLLVPSFTFLLIFAPLIGLLSAAPSLPLVYGWAEVLGLATGLALVLVGRAGARWRFPAALERMAATYGLGRRGPAVHLPGPGGSSPGLEVIPLGPRDGRPPP